MQAAPEGSWGMSLPNYTLEWWCQNECFSTNNRGLSLTLVVVRNYTYVLVI